ncbi:MAG TPA: AbrB/MazE/SpoVT family DNA-binding domain-containing protein [Blastocatellia bacterium]|nr:AbrB/MazE/SpoVT family DNA-binding domain-containing protein [Blastocatellia bacterium]
MPLVRIKRFSQVTLPPDMRKKFHLNEGDYLEAEATGDGILLKPVTVVERNKAWSRIFDVIENGQERKAKSKKAGKAEEEEIARIVKASRKKANA